MVGKYSVFFAIIVRAWKFCLWFYEGINYRKQKMKYPKKFLFNFLGYLLIFCLSLPSRLLFCPGDQPFFRKLMAQKRR